MGSKRRPSRSSKRCFLSARERAYPKILACFRRCYRGAYGVPPPADRERVEDVRTLAGVAVIFSLGAVTRRIEQLFSYQWHVRRGIDLATVAGWWNYLDLGHAAMRLRIRKVAADWDDPRGRAELRTLAAQPRSRSRRT